jgi:uncharacterized protein VirK/YbjX
MSKQGLSTRQDQGRRKADAATLLSSLAAGTAYLLRRGAHFMLPRAQRAARLLICLPHHLQVLRVLKHPQSAGLARQYPRMAFKYLDSYVALRLPIKTRRSIFVAHFRFLQRAFNARFIDVVQRLSPTLWHQTIEQHAFRVAIELIAIMGREGELRLVFYMDDNEVYRLIFVFASGRDFDLADETVAIVSGIQGAHDFERVKLATRTCCDVQPAHILMAALGAIAEATHVSTILGLHEQRQLLSGEKLFFSYARFFETYGTEIPHQQMYRIRVPYPNKPMLEVKASHRRRNRQKREFRRDVRDQTLAAIQAYLA